MLPPGEALLTLELSFEVCPPASFHEHPNVLDMSQLTLPGWIIVHEETAPAVVPTLVCFTLGATFHEAEGASSTFMLRVWAIETYSTWDCSLCRRLRCRWMRSHPHRTACRGWPSPHWGSSRGQKKVLGDKTLLLTSWLLLLLELLRN